MSYFIHTHYGDAVAESFAVAVELRAEFGGHITESEPERCPSCNTRNARTETYIGTLGNVRHHRCRACGSDYVERGSR